MPRPAMAPTTTAPTATPIPAIAGAASPPPEEEVVAVVGELWLEMMEIMGVGEELWPGVMEIMGVGVELWLVVMEMRRLLPVANQSSRYSRLTVDLCDVESQ